MTTIVWFRRDLRLEDNAALYHAADGDGEVVPLFIWSPDQRGGWPPGARSRWWLRQSLEELTRQLNRQGLPLILRRGPAVQILPELAQALEADAVFWNQVYEPPMRSTDDQVVEALRAAGVDARVFPGRLLHDPPEIETTSGGPYRVFTPFWRRLQDELHVPDPLPCPELRPPVQPPESVALDDLINAPQVEPALVETWAPGEKGAHARLHELTTEVIAGYEEMRDRPDERGTSMLSPHLHFGEVSPRQVWRSASRWADDAAKKSAAEPFLRQIAWREFSYHVLFHHPHTSDEPLRPEYARFPWHDDEALLETWRRGRTGYPIVDAGMRQLEEIGWMHNRVRMIVASFLTKDLLIPWQRGAEHFWEALVDADLANNTMGWQWAAGCGADPQPYFRIFNPVTQGRRHDPDGNYVRRWLPELDNLPTSAVHSPWKAPAELLDEAGVRLGDHYPAPVVDHAEARRGALAAYEHLKGNR